MNASAILIRYLASIACGVLWLGCGGCSNGQAQATIQGNVTLDGKPLAQGAIRLAPLSGNAQTAGAAIENGIFATKAIPANYRVEISATEVQGATGGRIDKFAPNDNLTVVALIPPRYNTQSELTLEVQPGLNQPTFDLKSR